METPDVLRDVFLCLQLYELKYTREVTKTWNNFFIKEYGKTLKQRLFVKNLSIIKQGFQVSSLINRIFYFKALGYLLFYCGKWNK